EEQRARRRDENHRQHHEGAKRLPPRQPDLPLDLARRIARPGRHRDSRNRIDPPTIPGVTIVSLLIHRPTRGLPPGGPFFRAPRPDAFSLAPPPPDPSPAGRCEPLLDTSIARRYP